MGTPWDRAAEAYVEEWVPRFVPYHLDLIRELLLRPGDRVLVVAAGPGVEALAAARAVDLEGYVRVTDQSAEMVRLARERLEVAGYAAHCDVAPASDAAGGPWDEVICAFGMWQLSPSGRESAVKAWGEALSENGKVGVLIWGPADESDPFEQIRVALESAEPGFARPLRDPAERDALADLFGRGGLSIVRHTVVRHRLTFPTADAFVRAMREGCVLRRVWEEIGDVRMQKVATAFFDAYGGPDKPVSFEPAATLVVAARPGAEVELESRASVRAPSLC